MIVRKRSGFRIAVRLFLLRNWAAIPLIVLIEFLVSQRDELAPAVEVMAFSPTSVGTLATVVGIFLVFRFNEAYERWWEARTLWGNLVNASRKWGRQVTTLLTPDRIGRDPGEQALATTRHRLVRRHLAYVNALRQRLREQDHDEDVSRFLDPGEFEALGRSANLATQLIQRQAEELASLFGSETSSQLLLMELDSTLNELYDAQGGCERIKTTIFPMAVTAVARIFVWGIVVLISIVFLEPGRPTDPLEYVAIFFVCLSFLVVGQLSAMLKNPFENQENDTPMTALCRTIEIDLLQQLGETEIPEPIQPVNGVLM